MNQNGHQKITNIKNCKNISAREIFRFFAEKSLILNKSNFLSVLFLALAITLFQSKLMAETIELPEDELATETVTPIYDTPDVVKNRNIVTEKKFELGGYLGWNTTEPIYNQTKFGLNLLYF